MKDDKVYIDHILQSIQRILSYISGKDYSKFIEDTLTQDAVIRQLEIIGEAPREYPLNLEISIPTFLGQIWRE
ncbi:MAG: DUF86 domain-containing protein [Cyclobacteriaceae bacterium]|nr:DUF86 domain-containing protein [Cyclobacteriaceae bacterium]